MTTVLEKSRPSTKKAQSQETVPKARKTKTSANIDPGHRHGLIAEAAYLIAEKRNFQGEAALDDWLQAEVEIDARLASKK